MANAARATETFDTHSLNRLAAFLVGVILPGAIIGALSAPNEWYGVLAKPGFAPGAGAFTPIWLIMYALVAFAGWRVWMKAPRSSAVAAWGTQLVLAWAWSPAFFALHFLWLALAIIGAMLGAAAFFIWRARTMDQVAAWAFLPNLVWVAYLTLVNAAVAVLN